MAQSAEYRRILARMGYYDYQNGLIHRHLNQEGGWDSHLDRSRAYIMKMIDLYKPDKVTVLGSGWLLELPVAEIIEQISNLTLIDIVHPPDVVKQAGIYKNVTLIEDDVTGGLIAEVWEKAGGFSFFRKPVKLSEIVIPEYKPETDPGMVISLNLITQLESLIVDFLRKKITATEEEFFAFRYEIQKKHLRFLKMQRSVLITDYQEIFTGMAGEKKIVPTLLVELQGEKFSEEWTWNFDLQGADNFNSTSLMKVIAKTF
jgi:hypothetical protein